MKSNYLLKSTAFILAVITLIATAISGTGLVVCLSFGAYSDGKSALTRNMNDNILTDYAYIVENYIFDEPSKLKEKLANTGIQAKISSPDGSLYLLAGENDTSVNDYSLTIKCVYLDNYEYTTGNHHTRNYYVDIDGTLQLLPSDGNIYYISPEKMKHLLETGGKIVTPKSDVPAIPETLPSYPHLDETQIPVETEDAVTVPESAETDVPESDFEEYPFRLLEDNYTILSNGMFSPIYLSNKPITKYYTGAYLYSRDGMFGHIGNVLPDEIEAQAYTVKLTITENYRALNPDNYKYMLHDLCGDNMYLFIWLTPLLILLSILLLIYLCTASGHTKNGLRESWIEKIPTDLYLVICATVCLIPLWTDVEYLIYAASDIYAVGAIIGAMAIGYAAIFVGILMSIALRIKTKTIFSRTVILMAVKLILKGLKLFLRAVACVFSNIGVLWTNVLCSIGFIAWAVALSIASSHYWYDDPKILLMIFGFTVFPAIFIYTGYQQNKINRTCRKIADGKVDSKVNAKYMTPNHRAQAETVNRIGNGLSHALAERIKSEHLKTELITNVSHDLKTPLTSIVNYTDLLAKEQENTQPDLEKMREYTETISRQSARLKKLTEDLVEASKASTGNVEVRPERIDVSELLSQSVGEFADKFEAAGLTPVEKKPAEPIFILADGRHVWRIFENLLVNICKYSLSGTRVYVELSSDADRVNVTLKNISALPLSVNADELTERFVRGDASRHSEGSGLGLSIAKSLAELQGGCLEIQIDGDCFKASLTFKKA